MIAALLALFSMWTPSPDVIPRGWKGVKLEMRFEMGEGVRGLCLGYRVAEGDSLAAVAARQLGDAARANEIATLNPTVDPEHLKVGDLLWLPPRDTMRPGELPRLVYLDTLYPRRSYPVPLIVNGVIGRGPNGTLTLFIVPPTAAAEIEAPRGKVHSVEAVDRMVEQGRIERIGCGAPSVYAHADDPVARRIDTYRFERDQETGALSVALTSSQAFDKEGEPVPARDSTADGGGERKREALSFVLLAIGGAAGLLLLARRRRDAASPRFA